jgi:hypothetical protein
MDFKFPWEKEVSDENANDNSDEIKQKAAAFEAKQGKGQKGDEEQGAEEGDITDYIAPVEGVGRGFLKGGLKMAAKEAAEIGEKKLGKGLSERVLDYSKFNKQQRPTELTSFEPGAQAIKKQNAIELFKKLRNQ